MFDQFICNISNRQNEGTKTSSFANIFQIEFPSILLPPGISCGSIVDINVSRNYKSESVAAAAFSRLQTEIYNTFGRDTPKAPILRCRNATQTSVVLEWDPLHIATADLRSLTIYRNGSKAGIIPQPLTHQSTKITGLAMDTAFVFQLVLRTSAGTFSSEKLTVRTHKMTNLSGITVTPGLMPSALRESLQSTIERIGARMADTVRIDTTHFVCTEGRGPLWERATEVNIPVVVPDWVKGCERDGRVVGVRGYYLNADPRLRQVGPGVTERQQQQQRPQDTQRQKSHAANNSESANTTSTTAQIAALSSSSQRQRQQKPSSSTLDKESVTEPPTPPPKNTPTIAQTREDQHQQGENASEARDLTSPTVASSSAAAHTTVTRGSLSERRKESSETKSGDEEDSDDGDDENEDKSKNEAKSSKLKSTDKSNSSSNNDDNKHEKDDSEDTETENGEDPYSSASERSTGYYAAAEATSSSSKNRTVNNKGFRDDNDDGGADGQDEQGFDDVTL